jgi:hypothetical protein
MPILFPVLHTFMMNNPAVQAAIVQVMKQTSFQPVPGFLVS